jgi:hypothetical protein
VLIAILHCFSVGIASGATRKYVMLVALSPTVGTWTLAMLAKPGDIAFALAVEDMFDSLAWGRMKESSMRKGYVPLPWFLTTWSVTGPIALLKILWRSLRWPKISDVTLQSNGWRGHWKGTELARWSVARLIFLILLIPGPGIVLLGT